VISFELTDEQRLVQQTAREFADREIIPRARANDRNEHFDLELVAKLAEVGFLGSIVSEEYGGRGIDYRTYALIVEEVGRGDSSSVAKLFATEASVRSANSAIQVHGGAGYVDEYPVERYLRDARVTTLYEGTSQIQKLIIGRAVTGVNAMT